MTTAGPPTVKPRTARDARAARERKRNEFKPFRPAVGDGMPVKKVKADGRVVRHTDQAPQSRGAGRKSKRRTKTLAGRGATVSSRPAGAAGPKHSPRSSRPPDRP